ncbi:hypothetical protein BDP27DRAFT_283905 [Rhodocollybia butyracea]|uniref:Uncharacterized protein n=1 Tax=Rhodocollybia butyracea TaxID=206335 RepID=A0A9P5Q2E7_9AGAR|nr:hypothetical protein BDP27DRAFT_283905 [Rhodocollybia butyracea]
MFEEENRIWHTSHRIPAESCEFLVALDVVHPSVLPLPTLKSVPQAQLPAPTQLAKATKASSSQLAMQDLLKHMGIHLRSTSIKDIDWSDCVHNNITMDTISVHPEWVYSFIHQMSRRRELSTRGFHFLRDHVAGFGDVMLTESIYDRFVCNDDKPIITSTGQTPMSRSSESASYISTLNPSASTSWTETQILDLLKFSFNLDVATRNHQGNQQPELTAQHLPRGLGIPIIITDSVTWYSLKPDASLFRGLEPYLLVEVESQSKTNGYHRMLLYGASLVRWISWVCQYRFILPLLFVYMRGSVKLSYMYEHDDGKIQFVQPSESYNINARTSRLKLFTTIFNIVDREPIQDLYSILRPQIFSFREIIPRALTITTGNPDDSGHLSPILHPPR